MSLKDLPRLARTVVHLRPSQVLWRARYALRRRLRNGRRPASAPALHNLSDSVARLRSGNLPGSVNEGLPAQSEAIVGRLTRGLFQHLNEERMLGRPPNWLLGPCDHGRLWTVTLHYHRWAWELAQVASSEDPHAAPASELFLELVGDWIERCDLGQPGARHLAWNSYAIATRIGWWVRSALLLGPGWWSAQPAFAQRFHASLWQQAEHLGRNIEWDLRGNHLIRDAVGLAWAARFFDGPVAHRWGYPAIYLALTQAKEQVLADGGHFERSPMYHLHVRDDLRGLSQLIDEPKARERLQEVLRRMAEFAKWTQHPDGGIALLNDAALDDSQRITPEVHGGRHFADTGLAVWHGPRWTLFFDVGPLGPDYQPGHGHADNLTLECSYAGERLFVDPGTHSYDRDERRAYDRSTAAHNTVCVDSTNSSEVWHIFRVGRRARPIDVRVVADESHFDASAAHDGYAHLGGIIHRRRVLLSNDETLTITDRVEGNSPHNLEGGWLLAPGWTATAVEAGWQLERDGTSVRLQLQGPPDLQLSIETRPWHPRFGVEIPATRLVWRWQGPLPLQLVTAVAPSS
jgi:Heparinase II/III-like protein/Heparinase II/III N-terminus